MNMPGFTAEASLYKTSRHFYMAATGAISSAQVMPQQAQMLAARAGGGFWGGIPEVHGFVEIAANAAEYCIIAVRAPYPLRPT